MFVKKKHMCKYFPLEVQVLTENLNVENMPYFSLELIISMEFYKISSNCLCTINIHNNDIRLKDKTLYLT